ncbi:GBF-interacting protein 1-like isoform X2 [Hibiscus syriacus]|uniref:GBF-interacting protein 1-like isoform X2 n=1 Tax=Hibiscus syriacus TaxID=106335 RepID=UPI0019249576|nr:GBF-interacting protein 1-like isoform X2 [Hibiscus syriacus]
MVSGPRTEGLSPRVSKTIQSIKEIVGNHSDDDIYVALKEANMDPNETAQKLLHQDTFHVVRRKKDRKKEIIEHEGSMDPKKNSENVGQRMIFRTYPKRGPRRGGYTRAALPGNAGVNREFRVVRDNRVNQIANKDMKPSLSQCSTSLNEQVPISVADKGSTGTPNNQRSFSSQRSSQTSSAPSSSHAGHVRDANSGGVSRKEITEQKQIFNPNAASRSQAVKPNNFQAHSGTQSSSSSVVGVYSSSTDPVHVPSPDSRSSGAVGAIKREVGVVGVRRHPPEDDSKDSSGTNTLSNSLVGRDTSSEAFRPFPAISRADREVRDTHRGAAESSMSGISGSRSFVNNPYGGRQHQQVLVHQKANHHNKEWKPKSSQKSSVNNPGVIGTPKKSNSPPADDAKYLDSETAKLQEKLSQFNIYENDNVIIAQHIRVPENDHHGLTFGSFGVENDSSRNLVPGFHASGVAGDLNVESAASLPVSSPGTSSDDNVGKPINILDDQLGNSGSDSPASSTASEHQLSDKKDAPIPQNLDSYTDIGMVQDNSQSYAPSEAQQQQDPPELPGFSAYDPQTGYDLPYFRPSIDETATGQGLLSPREALSLNAANTPASTTIPMMQQQQPQVAQMYPQVQMPHFANLMPYRQFVSPIYLPQMAMPGYSSNPAFPHPSNGSSYLLMPGGSTHIGANGVKYGIQQFKPVPAGNPTGFENFTSPSGYAINAPGVVGSATGLEDSSRTKYKDGNIYVQNQQADTPDFWMQNPRELQNMQSAAYYNMPQTPHGYMPSPTGHASFNAAAAAQSSHMQFSGLYLPPLQPAAMANPHHLNPAMGANVGFGVAPAAPGAQLGAYQQPQLGHLNWTSNF